MSHVLHEGDCLDVLPTIPAGSIDAVICDPPYPCIDRDYGTWTVDEWFAMMDRVVSECRRVLKPKGSAVFVLQPNSERVGRMRTWLWDFLAKWGREWGVVQDAYWWNLAALPTVHCHRDRGLMRPSVKTATWLGVEDCYRNQDAVLWEESERNEARRLEGKCGNDLQYRPSGYSMRLERSAAAASERGGTTPFNLIPMGNTESHNKHPGSTPLALMRWWVRYLCPPGGIVLDPFAGSGTLATAASCEGRDSVSIERVPEYCSIIRRRIAEATGPLFSMPTPDVPTEPLASQPSLFGEGDVTS